MSKKKIKFESINWCQFLIPFFRVAIKKNTLLFYTRYFGPWTERATDRIECKGMALDSCVVSELDS